MPILQVICSSRRVLVVALWFSVLLPLSNANAEVSVAIGPTTIPRGDATGARDITISKDLLKDLNVPEEQIACDEF